jgi:hypothetical protein
MAFMLTRIHVDDYDAWKRTFDSDPPGARTAAKGHRIMRSAENPHEVFIQVEFGSTEDADTAREKLLAYGLHDRVDVKAGPTVTEEAEVISY